MANPMLPLVEMLREVNKEMKSETLRLLILPVMTESIKTNIEKKWGERIPKVGIFGPYPDGGEQILHIVAQKAAKRGYMAIMGSGFYLPSDPTRFHEITELLPPVLGSFLALPPLEFYLYRYILPSLIDKATNNLYPYRTNAYELEGCVERGKPVLGHIINSDMASLTNYCPQLSVDLSSPGIGMECSAKDPNKCQGQAPNRPKCPFIDIVNVPWVAKQWFMLESQWILVGLGNIDKIDVYLDRFLK